MTSFHSIRRTVSARRHFEKEMQHIPQKYEMGKLMRAIQNEPILYRAYYTLGNHDRIAAWGTVCSAMEGHNRCL